MIVQYLDGYRIIHYQNKSPSNLIEEYDLSPASIYQWRKQYGNNSNVDVTVGNKESIDELRNLREENQKLRMEVNILKQATLIMGRKSK